MSSRSEQLHVADTSFNLRSIALIYLRGWKAVILCAGLAIYLASNYLESATYIYPTQMQVTPVQATGDESSSSRLGALSGLASIAGVSLPGNQNATQFRLYLDSLYSRDLAEELSKNQQLMRTVFAGEWDSSAGAWRQPPETALDKYKQRLRSELGFPAAVWQPPNAARLQGFLHDQLQVIQDPRKPYLATVEFDYPDREFGIGFLTLLNQTADNQLRQRALLRTRQYIDYLSKQLRTVTIAEHREAITQTLSEQEKFAMVAASEAPFAAEVFDRPSAGSLPITPVPRQVMLSAVVLGVAAGGVLSFVVRMLIARMRAMFGFGRRKAGLVGASHQG